MAILYLKTTAMEITNDADELRDEITMAEDELAKENYRRGERYIDVKIDRMWIEVTALRPPKSSETPDPKTGMVESVMHVRSGEIVAVAE